MKRFKCLNFDSILQYFVVIVRTDNICYHSVIYHIIDFNMRPLVLDKNISENTITSAIMALDLHLIGTVEPWSEYPENEHCTNYLNIIDFLRKDKRKVRFLVENEGDNSRKPCKNSDEDNNLDCSSDKHGSILDAIYQFVLCYGLI